MKLDSQEDVMRTLREYFARREEIVMVFLYGSWARKRVAEESDVDIAVYFRPADGVVERENPDFQDPGEGAIWRDLEAMLDREVDLLILNRAAPTIAESALKGAPVVIKDQRLYRKFLERISREATDFRQWVEEYWNLKERMHRAAGP